jgi:hypothetical protein
VPRKDDLSTVVLEGVENSLIGGMCYTQCRDRSGAGFGFLPLLIEQSGKSRKVIEAIVGVPHTNPFQRAAANVHASDTVINVAPSQRLVELLKTCKIHRLSGVIAVGTRRLEDIREGVFHPGRYSVIRSVGDHTGNPAKGHQCFGQCGKTLRVAEKIACPHHHIRTQFDQLSNPPHAGAVPGRHVDVAEVQNPNGLTTGVEYGKGFSSYTKVFPLD